MKSLLILSIVTLTYYADGRIIGGEEAPKHAFPWQISLRGSDSHICGGSIINKNQVISAAHCVATVKGSFGIRNSLSSHSILAGAHNRLDEDGPQLRSIKSMEAHEDHDSPPFNNDVAIITVTEPFDFSDPNVQPIEMFTKSNDAEIPAETVCNSTGWGLTEAGSLPEALQWVQIPVLSKEDCEKIFSDTLTDGMVCAGSPEHTACNGDSGGPLVCPDAEGKDKLAGVVNFGRAGCTEAAVWAKVSYFEDWIQEKVVS